MSVLSLGASQVKSWTLRVLVSLLASLALYGEALAASDVPTLPEIEDLIRRSLLKFGRSNATLFEPGVSASLSSSAWLFVENFCYPKDSDSGKATCGRTVLNEQVTDRVVFSYMRQAMAGESPIEHVGARFAKEIGRRFEETGWPGRVDNTIGVVHIPPDLRSASFAVHFASGQVNIGSKADAIAMRPGEHTLIISRPRISPYDYSVTVRPGESVTLQSLPVEGVRTAQGRIEPPLSQRCFDVTPAKLDQVVGHFNWGRAAIAETAEARQKYTSSIAMSAGLNIDVQDLTGGTCRAKCKDALAISFASAIATWRAGCARCNPDALSVVRIGDHVWLDSSIAHAIRRDIKGKASAPASVAVAPAIGSSFGVSYEEADRDPDLRSKVCAMRIDGASWAPAARQAVCGGPPGLASAAMTATVKLIRGPTQCGPSSVFIACGLPNAGIEITTDNARLRALGPTGELVIGNNSRDPEIDLMYVVLHEVGHWFGVPHAEVSQFAVRDVMSAIYGAGRPCVSGTSLTMLNNASDTRWPYRVAAGGGLMRPQSVVVPKR